MRRRSRGAALAAAAIGLLAVPVPGWTQPHAHAGTGSGPISLGGMVVLLGSQVDPAVRSMTLREWYLSQPMLMLGAKTSNGLLSARVTWNLEGALMRRGELTAGIYGEGYIDRRHPHTALHEVMGTAQHAFGATTASVSSGKGIIPFGSDDPMMRPFQKFPVNHHISQILERAVAIGALRHGILSLEGSLFNGDEPESPGDMPNLDRFGDSWSTRATLTPVPGLEATVSVARVASPEDANGKGLNQRKVHGGIRYEANRANGLQYLLVEHGETGEYRGPRRAWDFTSTLTEGRAAIGLLHVALRLERTTRPDEARTEGDFRSFRPVLDFSILGRSRWDTGTLNISTRRQITPRVAAMPFAEASLSKVTPTILPTTFVPSDFYGSSRLWTLTFGLRLHAGKMPARMGRYGAASIGEQ